MSLPSIKSMTMFLLVSLLVFLPLMPACGGSGDEGPKTQSVLGALTNTYDDPLILEYYQRANQAYINAGYDLARLSLNIGKCVGTTAAIPILGIIGCTNTFYDVYETAVKTGKDWGEISLLYDRIESSQKEHGFSVFHLDPNDYPQVPEQFRTFYSWNDFRELNAATVLEPIVGSGTQIADLAASPYGEFARLSLQYYEGKMQTVIVNVNPMFLSVPQATKTPTAASPSSGSLGSAKSPWPMFQHDPQRTGRSTYSGPETPTLKWKFNIDGSMEEPPAIGADGTIYLGSGYQDASGYAHGRLYAIDPNGSFKWSYDMDRESSTPAIGDDGTIYAGSGKGTLYAINPNGSLRWSCSGGYYWDNPPIIGTDGTIYVGDPHEIYAIAPNGSIKWSYTFVEYVYDTYAIGTDGTIYYSSPRGGNLSSKNANVYAIDSNGSLKWKYQMEWGSTQTPAIGADGTIYVLDKGGKLYALTPNGSLKWSYSIFDGSLLNAYRGISIGADDTVYIRDDRHNIYAISPSGSLKWSSHLEIYSWEPFAIGADGTIYAGTSGVGIGKIDAISPDGSLKWSYTYDDFNNSSRIGALAIGANSTIYVVSEGTLLWAIGE